jgi:hypothetical protein
MAQLSSSRSVRKLPIVILFCLFATAFAAAQDIKLNVTYVCNGERLYVESCNIRDTSDTSTCQVAHPDRPQHNGFMAYTSETRGNLKKLLPACTQPTAADIAKLDAFQKKQQQALAAETAKYNPTPAAAPATSSTQSLSPSQVAPPKNAEERAIRRCVSSGRLPATCTGNSLLSSFGNMISSTVSSLTGTSADAANAKPNAGPDMSGVYQGAGGWHLDFVDGGVLVNCSTLSPNQEAYSLAFRSTGAVLTIATTPKPLVLNVHADGSITGPPGPVTIDGVYASGYNSGDAPGAMYKDAAGNEYDANRNKLQTTPGSSTFSPRRVTCPAVNLTKGSGVGIQTMQTNLLKSVFSDGDSGPPTPVGIRMHGIFAAASTGFSLQFFPESVILGCGPDSARAYPYTVAATAGGGTIKIDAPDHPLSVAFRPDGSLDPGSGAYQVHGRIVTGQNDDGDFTFAPMEQTCSLAVLTPAKEIPSSGGAAATMVASTSGPATAAAGSSGGLSTPTAPLGNATLAIVSGLAGTPNPLAGRPYILLRDTYDGTLAKAGVTVPPGTSALKFVGMACGGPTKSPDCPKILAAINASAASAVRSDTSGSGTFPGVPPGTYYLMISAVYNQQPLIWNQAVQLKAGANSLTLNPGNATPFK